MLIVILLFVGLLVVGYKLDELDGRNILIYCLAAAIPSVIFVALDRALFAFAWVALIDAVLLIVIFKDNMPRAF